MMMFCLSNQYHGDLQKHRMRHSIKMFCSGKAKSHIEHQPIIHSNRKLQYTSSMYRELTKEVITSYLRKGTLWDNAYIKSIHSPIKRE